MESPKTPPDVEEMTELYKVGHGGICGQACLAMIEGTSIASVLRRWGDFGLIFKGWSGWNQLKTYLKSRGYTVKQRNGLQSYHPEKYYIARVQWFGPGENKEKPYYGWNHWSEASANTHFITIIRNQWFFCNEDGLMNLEVLPAYLSISKGVITSHMEVTPNN